MAEVLVVDNVMHARLRLCDGTTERRRSVRRHTASEPSLPHREACGSVVQEREREGRVSYLLIGHPIQLQLSFLAVPKCTRPKM